MSAEVHELMRCSLHYASSRRSSGGVLTAFGRGQQHHTERRGILRMRQEESLGVLAPEFAQPVELAFGLDALGNRVELQRLRQPDDRTRERRLLRVAVDTDDERSIDLQDVDREALEVAQRRVARPE